MKKQTKKIRVGSNVKIISCSKKKYIGKVGKIWHKRRGSLNPDKTEYCVYLYDVLVWVGSDDIIRVGGVE